MSEKTITEAEAPARFTAAHKVLTDALKTAGLAVYRAAQIPVMRGVLAGAWDGVVTLKAFDYETAITVQVDGKPDGVGLSLYGYDELKAMLAGVVAGEKPADAARVPVTLDGGVLSTPDMAVPLETLDAGEYPAFPPAAPPQAVVDGASFFLALGRVLPARGTDVTLPVTQSVRLRIRDGALHLAATDQYRASLAELTAEARDPDGMDALVSGDVLAKLAVRVGRHTGPVSVGTHASGGERFTTFGFGAVTVTLRCKEGSFPPVENLLPREAATAVTVDRAALVRAVKKATALSGTRKGCGVRVEFTADGPVRVAPEWWDVAAQEHTRGVTVAGDLAHGSAPAWPLKANGSFLLDGLAAFTGSTVTLHVSRESKPFLLTAGPGIAGDGIRYLQMPVRRH